MSVILIHAASAENRQALEQALLPMAESLVVLPGLQAVEPELAGRKGACSLLVIDSDSESPDIYALLNRITAYAATAQVPVLWLAPSLSSVQRRLYQDLLYGICVLIKPCPPERIIAAAAVCLHQAQGLLELQKLHAGADWTLTLKQGLLGLGEDGRIRYANRAASQLLHIPPLQLAGLYIQSLMEAPVVSLLPQQLPPALAQVLEQQKTVELAMSPLWRGDGRNMLCHAAVVPARTSGFALLFAFRQLPPSEIVGPDSDPGRLPALDLLTGLPTLVALEQTLLAVLELDDSRPALMVMDIDHLRHINETLGYELGDQLVRMAAGRLQQAMAGLGTLFRIAGDRFVALIDRVSDFREAGRLAQRFNAQFRQPFLLGGNEVYCGLSVGVALHPGSGDTAESLLQSGEVALEKAKSLGRNIVQFYSAEMNRHSLEQMERETALHHVLGRPELPVQMLPWLRPDGSAWALSACLDWQPPGDTGISVMEVAEESGLQCPLCRRVMNQVLSRQAAFAPLPPALRLLFTLPVSCLRDPRIVGRITTMVAHNHWEPGCIQLNLRLDGEDWAWLEPLLQDLVAHGLQLGLCLNRYGPPLEALSRLSWHSLILEPPLTAAALALPRMSEVVAGLIGFGQALGLPVLAAGVGSREQADWLYGKGVAACSGGLLASPLSLAETGAWVRDHCR